MVFNELEIENFRGAKHLILPNLKRINLLIGKNNCGKSTVLDALFLLSGFSNPLLSVRINQFRNYTDFKPEDIALNFYNMDLNNHIKIRGSMLDGAYRNLKITPIVSESKTVIAKENLSNHSLSNKEANVSTGLTMHFSYNKNTGEVKHDSSAIVISDKENKEELEIINSKEYKEALAGIYINSNFQFNIAVESLVRIIEEKQDKEIVKILQQVEPKIKSITVLRSVVNVDIGLDRLVPINMLGDGIRKLLAIIVSLYGCKNGIIFIDEIDNGMHFSSLSSLWKAIISTSKLLNIQVFATTHNIESLQSINRVLSDSAFADSRADIMCYSLRHLPTDILKSYEYPYEKFQYVINQEIEIR